MHCVEKSSRWDSNTRPSVHYADALPTVRATENSGSEQKLEDWGFGRQNVESSKSFRLNPEFGRFFRQNLEFSIFCGFPQCQSPGGRFWKVPITLRARKADLCARWLH